MERVNATKRMVKAGMMCAGALIAFAAWSGHGGFFFILMHWLLLPGAMLHKLDHDDLKRSDLAGFAILWAVAALLLFFPAWDGGALVGWGGAGLSLVYTAAAVRLDRPLRDGLKLRPVSSDS